MTTYDVLIKRATRLRDLKLTPLARLCYRRALRIGGDQDRHCQHMMAVCYTMEHRGKKADRWFAKALEGASDYERGNIFRDRGKRFIISKDHLRAMSCLEEALELLPESRYPAAYAQTKGFIGQAKAQAGKRQEAESYFTQAEAILCQQPDLRPCLFNRVHWAKNLLELGDYQDAGDVADEANMLAYKLKLWPYRVKTRWLMIRADLKEGHRIDL